MKFTKMQGTGNDFIVINNIELAIPIEKLSIIAKKVCERRLSVGGDALMVVDKPEKGGDFQMRFYNSDGTIGEMCGNGARCIARYAYENKIAGESMLIETLAGNVRAWKMGKREFKIRLNSPEVLKLDNNIIIDSKEYECSYIELGNPGLPHAVVKLEGLEDLEDKKIFELGSKIRHNENFPKGANVNFYEIIEGNEVRLRTFERGVEDFTLACGTGSGSTATILTLKGNVERDKKVKLYIPGGVLSVNVELNKNKVENVYLTGDTKFIAVGEIIDEDLCF